MSTTGVSVGSGDNPSPPAADVLRVASPPYEEVATFFSQWAKGQGFHEYETDEQCATRCLFYVRPLENGARLWARVVADADTPGTSISFAELIRQGPTTRRLQREFGAALRRHFDERVLKAF
ncbi:MAG TPA: hypothetical protein VK572_16715 [Burkholderiales bacterium]|nr:hypothetical protein [Burkholderiales bacterium]